MTQLPTQQLWHLSEETQLFYTRGAQALVAAGIPFLVGGAYALGHFTGIERFTKDFDLFVKPEDKDRALETLAEAGYRTELTFPHWLGKAYHNGDFIDVIFSSGNGIAMVDDEWFANAPTGNVLGMALKLCPAEEVIWSKSFILERERFDGADIAHLFRECAETLDWDRLLRRFGERWRVLFSHLVIFGFVYPDERSRIPARIMHELISRLQVELSTAPPDSQLCRGTLLSREQYLVDVKDWGYRDPRLQGEVAMTPADVERWTKAIDEDEHSHHHKNVKEDGENRNGSH